MSENRAYTIEDEGDEFQLALYEDGYQIGGACFPDDGTGRAFEIARDFAAFWSQTEKKPNPAYH